LVFLTENNNKDSRQDNKTMILQAYISALKQFWLYDSKEAVIKEISCAQGATPSGENILDVFIKAFEDKFNPGLHTESLAKALQDDEPYVAEQKPTLLPEEIKNHKVIQRLFNLLDATVRTNHYQVDEIGYCKRYISLKFDGRKIEDLPQSPPMFEIFVYSPSMEGCHLRSAMVSRGGIRWSERDDYRSEVLQLMQTQTLKNAVIVPSGAKGGFICKNISSNSTAEEIKAEVTEGYKTLINGMLDLTNNWQNGKSLPIPNTVCYDGPDYYLVAAADKGTAQFSDLANQIATERGFWLGDAFASGGKTGYNHKGLAITSKGAWVSVRRHFYELGIDCDLEDFTVVGVGDMGGDVFGNGMLQTKHLKLLAAFDHRHIFIDPNPNPQTAYNERKRLFELPSSSWDDYDRGLISKGGSVYKRDSKDIILSSQASKILGLREEENHLSPNELISLILRSKVDLLWFGGIGNFIKASFETNFQAADSSNDSCRINADQVRAKVIGEGANLALTQNARIEYSLLGGKINSDAIDNSGGVDCSDREVNLKILLESEHIKDKSMILKEAVGNVVEKIIDDNTAQNLILSLEDFGLKQHPNCSYNDIQKKYCDMEIAKDILNYQYVAEFLGPNNKGGGTCGTQRIVKFERNLYKIPTALEFQERITKKTPLTRPEKAVIMAYVKIYLARKFLKCIKNDENLSSIKELNECYHEYFPKSVDDNFKKAVDNHILKPEIMATIIANMVVNVMGVCWCIKESQKHNKTDFALALEFLKEFNKYKKNWHNLVHESETKNPDNVYNKLIEIQNKIKKELKVNVLHGVIKDKKNMAK